MKCNWHRTAVTLFSPAPLALTRGFETHNYNIDFHDHDFCEINIIFEGRGVHYIEEQKFDASPGDVFVIPPGTPHAYKSLDETFNVFHLIAKDAFFTKYEDDLKRLSRIKFLFEIEPYLRTRDRKLFLNLDYEFLLSLKADATLFEKLKDDSSDEANTLRNIYTLKIIFDLCRYMPANVDNSYHNVHTDHVSILKGLDFIHNHYADKITIDKLAEICNMSRATFIRQFKKCCATTPNQYILNYRLELAKKLLAAGQSKTRVAQECGFFDLSHMEKMMQEKCCLRNHPMI